VILAQLRAATAAGSIEGAENNDEEDDRLIDLAVNAVMGVSRDVSGSSFNSRASRASSVKRRPIVGRERVAPAQFAAKTVHRTIAETRPVVSI
jgi:hypothetical protein